MDRKVLGEAQPVRTVSGLTPSCGFTRYLSGHIGINRANAKHSMQITEKVWTMENLDHLLLLGEVSNVFKIRIFIY